MIKSKIQPKKNQRIFLNLKLVLIAFSLVTSNFIYGEGISSVKVSLQLSYKLLEVHEVIPGEENVEAVVLDRSGGKLVYKAVEKEVRLKETDKELLTDECREKVKDSSTCHSALEDMKKVWVCEKQKKDQVFTKYKLSFPKARLSDLEKARSHSKTCLSNVFTTNHDNNSVLKFALKNCRRLIGNEIKIETFDDTEEGATVDITEDLEEFNSEMVKKPLKNLLKFRKAFVKTVKKSKKEQDKIKVDLERKCNLAIKKAVISMMKAGSEEFPMDSLKEFEGLPCLRKKNIDSHKMKVKNFYAIPDKKPISPKLGLSLAAGRVALLTVSDEMHIGEEKVKLEKSKKGMASLFKLKPTDDDPKCSSKGRIIGKGVLGNITKGVLRGLR